MFHLWNVSHKGVSFLPKTPQTSQAQVRIERRLVLIIANKELLCNITQHLRIDTKQ